MVALLFHTMSNLSASILPYIKAEKGAEQMSFLFAAVLNAIVVLVVVAFAGPRKSSFKPEA